MTLSPTSLVCGLVLALAAGCAAGSPERSSGSRGPVGSPASTSPQELERRPAPLAPREGVVREVPQAQWQAMVDAGMVRPECPVQERAELRRVDLPYVDFEGHQRRGHLVVHRDTAESALRIFERIHDEGFPIARMQGVEAYDGDVGDSLADNNTSAYNCRRADQINAPFAESPHANGRAVDVNPVQNPWVDLRCRCWTPGPENHERTPGPGKILEGGPVWQAFDDEGWTWQNIAVPDYMHFDTGYPSVPYERP